MRPAKTPAIVAPQAMMVSAGPNQAPSSEYCSRTSSTNIASTAEPHNDRVNIAPASTTSVRLRRKNAHAGAMVGRSPGVVAAGVAARGNRRSSTAETRYDTASATNGTQVASRKTSEPSGGPTNSRPTSSAACNLPFASSRQAGATKDGMALCEAVMNTVSPAPMRNVMAARATPGRLPTTNATAAASTTAARSRSAATSTRPRS